MPKKKKNPNGFTPQFRSLEHREIWKKMDCLDSKVSDLKNIVIELVTWGNVWKWLIPIIVILTVLTLGKLIML